MVTDWTRKRPRPEPAVVEGATCHLKFDGGVYQRLQVFPRRTFRTERIVLAGNLLGLRVRDVLVGGRSQVEAFDITAAAFTDANTPLYFCLDPCDVGDAIAVELYAAPGAPVFPSGHLCCLIAVGYFEAPRLRSVP